MASIAAGLVSIVLVMNSSRVLSEVALDCGFADQSHFTRMFQRTVNISPGAWRRMHRR